MNKLISLIALLLCAACAENFSSYEAYLHRRNLEMPQKDSIQHCRGYGCQYIDTVKLTHEEWQSITHHFQPRAQTAKIERAQIAQAIGTMETIIGQKTGSHKDVKGTFIRTGTYQLDCVDESTNTTLYLAALKDRNLIKLHEIQAPDVRLPIIHAGRWPHQTAIILETKTQQRYAVDSWFHDNGKPAEIIQHDQWKKGWKSTKDPDDGG